MCDICHDESGGHDVGVAAVPAAPLSVMWCNNCLRNNAIPVYVLETWMFAEFDELELEMPKDPPEFRDPSKFPLTGWVGEMTIWREGCYKKIKDVHQTLWAEEYERRQNVPASN